MLREKEMDRKIAGVYRISCNVVTNCQIIRGFPPNFFLSSRTFHNACRGAQSYAQLLRCKSYHATAIECTVSSVSSLSSSLLRFHDPLGINFVEFFPNCFVRFWFLSHFSKSRPQRLSFDLSALL